MSDGSDLLVVGLVLPLEPTELVVDGYLALLELTNDCTDTGVVSWVALVLNRYPCRDLVPQVHLP